MHLLVRPRLPCLRVPTSPGSGLSGRERSCSRQCLPVRPLPWDFIVGIVPNLGPVAGEAGKHTTTQELTGVAVLCTWSGRGASRVNGEVVPRLSQPHRTNSEVGGRRGGGRGRRAVCCRWALTTRLGRRVGPSSLRWASSSSASSSSVGTPQCRSYLPLQRVALVF
jgi:hypothetical protein